MTHVHVAAVKSTNSVVDAKYNLSTEKQARTK